MSNHDELTERVTNLVHAVKGGNFGMEWTRWNSANQAEHIIGLVRADERKRIREALEAKYEAVRTGNTDIMGGYDSETAGVLEGLAFALGLTEEGGAS